MDRSHLDDGSVATEAIQPAPALAAPSFDAQVPARSGRRRLAIGASAAVVIAAGAVAAIVLLGSGSPSHARSGTGVPRGETTATVTRRTLTETATVEGTLGYTGSYELYDRLSEAGTFTWLPAAGTVVRRGGTLFRVNNKPVVLMYGDVPAYRTLEEGVANGPDVSQLNRNLKALGFDPYDEITELDYFSAATGAAVRRWQHAEGFAATGAVELGRVDFAPAAQRITKVDVSLGEDPPGETAVTGPTGPTGPTSTATTPETETPAAAPATETSSEEGSKEQSSKKSHSAKGKRPNGSGKGSLGHGHGHGHGHGAKGNGGTGSTTPETRSKSPETGSASPEAGSKSPESGSKSPGGAGAGGMLVLDTSSTQQVVQVQVKANEQGLAHVGDSAPVLLPSGRVVQGRINYVGSVASESSSGAGGEKGPGGEGSEGGENATIPVTLVLEHPLLHLDDAPVSVELVKSVRRNVLAVPATALAATAGGGYAIEALESGRRVELSVTPGMFANSYVQIEGPGVHEGLTVIEAE